MGGPWVGRLRACLGLPLCRAAGGGPSRGQARTLRGRAAATLPIRVGPLLEPTLKGEVVEVAPPKHGGDCGGGVGWGRGRFVGAGATAGQPLLAAGTSREHLRQMGGSRRARCRSPNPKAPPNSTPETAPAGGGGLLMGVRMSATKALTSDVIAVPTTTAHRRAAMSCG